MGGPMANILRFPIRKSHGAGMERYLMSRERLALGATDPFANWVKILDAWFEAYPQARTKHNEALRSLLADTWLVFHMACDRTSRLEVKPHHSLRWAQLQYHSLSDFELLVIVSDNLTDLRRGVAQLCGECPSEEHSDHNLIGLIQSIDHLNQQLGRLFDPELSASWQPEW